MQQSNSTNPNLENNSFDLVIHQARLENHHSLMDIGIDKGLIKNIAANISSSSKKSIYAKGFLISPPLIDPHTHLDKCFLQPAPNKSGTLSEAISIMQVNKGKKFLESLEQRVVRALAMAVRNGTLVIRTHVDIDPKNTTKTIEILLKIRERWSGLVDLQIVAFPQEGILRHSNLIQHLKTAIRMGADAIGGIPSIEDDIKSAQAHIDLVFEIANEFNIPVDMHIDETDDPRSRTLEMLARTAIQVGWHNRVSAAHCCSLAAQDDAYAAEVIQLVAAAGITIITNPGTNLVLQGRNDRQPIRRGITRVKELLAAGVNVTCGSDNLRDVFYPFGQVDMLETAFLTSITAQLTGQKEILIAMDMPRTHAASCLGIKNYGIAVGNPADLILFPSDTIQEVLALRPVQRIVVRRGQVICETTEETRWVESLAGANPSSG